MSDSSPIVLTPPGAGRVFEAFGERVTLLIEGADSGGSCTQWLEEVPPGGGPPPHYHLHEDEWFFVLEGLVSFFDGRSNSWTELGPGGSAFMPREAVHTFRNSGDSTARLLVTTTPAGFENFFARCAEVFAQPGPPDLQRILAIGAEHGIRFV